MVLSLSLQIHRHLLNEGLPSIPVFKWAYQAAGLSRPPRHGSPQKGAVGKFPLGNHSPHLVWPVCLLPLGSSPAGGSKWEDLQGYWPQMGTCLPYLATIKGLLEDTWETSLRLESPNITLFLGQSGLGEGAFLLVVSPE